MIYRKGSYTRVTNAGLKWVAAHCGENLHDLDIASPKVTDAGLKEFKKEVPLCIVYGK